MTAGILIWWLVIFSTDGRVEVLFKYDTESQCDEQGAKITKEWNDKQHRSWAGNQIIQPICIQGRAN